MATQREGGEKHSRHYWQRHVRAQQESGLSRAEYCRQQNLSYHALTYDLRTSRDFLLAFYSLQQVEIALKKRNLVLLGRENLPNR